MTALQAPAIKLAEVRPKAQNMRPLALEYLAKQAFAEVKRRQVDKVQRRLLLGECPLFRDLTDGARVIDPKDYWLCQDDDACKAFYAAQDRELRAAGIKPDDMAEDFCPALVAENQAMDARRAVINDLAPLFDIDPKWLYGEKEDKFFELAMGLIMKA